MVTITYATGSLLPSFEYNCPFPLSWALAVGFSWGRSFVFVVS